MRFKQYHSSSMGNLYEVTSFVSGERLLLECGLTWKRIEKALGFDLSNIRACFVTHEHQDHCKAIESVMDAGIDVYASAGTFRMLNVNGHYRAFKLRDGRRITCGSFDVFPFNINHDAAEPLGFIVIEKETKEHLLFVPDTSHIVQRFAVPFDIIALECSYDRDILEKRVKDETINAALANRLLECHMGKDRTMNYIAEYCNLSRCHEIHLLHMSGENLDKRKTKKEFEDRFHVETIIV